MMYKILSNDGCGLEQYKVGDVMHFNDAAANQLLRLGKIEIAENQLIFPTETALDNIKEEKTEKKKTDDYYVLEKTFLKGFKNLMLYMNLWDAKKVLDDMGLDFWLNNGTLLGYYREGTFISNDTDIDLGIFTDRKDIIDKFKEYGFKLYKKYGSVKEGLEYSFIRNGYKLDIFLFKREKTGFYQFVWEGDDKMAYKFPKFKLEKATFHGLEVNVPENVEKILIAQYGKDWNVPKSDWDYYKDPENLCEK